MVYWIALSVLIGALTLFSIVVLFYGRNVNFAIISATPIIITSCIILWVGDVPKNVSIPQNVSMTIFGSFVVVTLTNAAMLIADSLKPAPLTLEACLVLNDANIMYDSAGNPYLTSLEERPNKSFSLSNTGDLIIAFGCKAKNFAADKNQDIDLWAEAFLMNENQEVASIDRPKDRKKIDAWKNGSLVKRLGEGTVSEYFNVAPNETLYIMIKDKINVAVTRDKSALTLSFRLFDKKSGKYAIFESPVHLAN